MISLDNTNLISIIPRDPRSFFRLGIYAVMLSYPITIFIVEGLRSQYFGFLVLLSLIALGINKLKYQDISLDRLEVLFLASLFMLFFVTFVSYVYFGFQDPAEKRVAKYSFFLFAIPVFYLIRYAKPRIEIVWIGVVIGCYVAFGRAILEELKLVDEFVRGATRQDPTRANGVMNPIRFGDLTMLMSFIALSGALYLKNTHKIVRFLGLIGFLVGVGASILSRSRGGWIAVPVMLVISLLPFYLAQGKNVRIIIIAAVFGALALAFMAPGSDVVKRFERAASEIESYYDEGNLNTSTGVRFFMFESAYNIFKDNKVFGVGVGMYRTHAIKYYESQKPNFEPWLRNKFYKWKNPHNEYFLHLATRGIVGIVVLVTAFAIGFYYFLKRRKTLSGETQFSAIAGMLIIAAYAQFGLTIALFEHRNFLVFFAIYLTMFAADKLSPVEQ